MSKRDCKNWHFAWGRSIALSYVPQVSNHLSVTHQRNLTPKDTLPLKFEWYEERLEPQRRAQFIEMTFFFFFLEKNLRITFLINFSIPLPFTGFLITFYGLAHHWYSYRGLEYVSFFKPIAKSPWAPLWQPQKSEWTRASSGPPPWCVMVFQSQEWFAIWFFFLLGHHAWASISLPSPSHPVIEHGA